MRNDNMKNQNPKENMHGSSSKDKAPKEGKQQGMFDSKDWSSDKKHGSWQQDPKGSNPSRSR